MFVRHLGIVLLFFGRLADFCCNRYCTFFGIVIRGLAGVILRTGFRIISLLGGSVHYGILLRIIIVEYVKMLVFKEKRNFLLIRFF